MTQPACLTALALAAVLAQQPQPPAIHDAAMKGDLQTVKALLEQDPALVNVEKPPNKKTALHYAAQGGHRDVVEFLLEKGAEVSRPNIIGETPLHYAATVESPDVAILLLARGANLNARTERGMTPLRLAMAFGRVATVKALLERGANPRETLPDGTTLLHIAAVNGPAEMVALVGAAGVDLDAPKRDGETALLAACTAGNMATAKALLALGANPNRRDAAGREPLVLAVRTGREDFVKLLLDAGAQAGGSPAAGTRGALNTAAAMGYGRIVDLLLAKGADRNARDGRGRTALDVATANGNTRIADKLRGGPASPDAGGHARPAASALTRPLSPGESIVWHLGHLGWAIRTANHFLIFDYDGRATTPSDEPSLAGGWIVPAEIRDLPTTVFITHGHQDHYAPAVFDWKSAVKDLTIVTGFKPEGKNGYEYVGPRESRRVGDLQITTTKAMDEGVGFHVTVDGINIFHSGDHGAAWGPDVFKPEIDFLADRGLRADLLFMPVQTGDIPILNDGLGYAIRRLSAGAVFPGHQLGREYVYAEVAQALAQAGFRVPVHCAEFGGDHFTVPARKTSR